MIVDWDSMFSFMVVDCFLHPLMLSILFRAIMNGILLSFRICRTSIVWGFRPSLMSITKIARSARDPPRFLK